MSVGGGLRFWIIRVDVIWIPKDGDPCEVRRYFAEILQALGGEIGGNEGDARDVAAGMGEDCRLVSRMQFR